jgi:hypothetical protein
VEKKLATKDRRKSKKDREQEKRATKDRERKGKPIVQGASGLTFGQLKELKEQGFRIE